MNFVDSIHWRNMMFDLPPRQFLCTVVIIMIVGRMSIAVNIFLLPSIPFVSRPSPDFALPR